MLQIYKNSSHYMSKTKTKPKDLKSFTLDMIIGLSSLQMSGGDVQSQDGS